MYFKNIISIFNTFEILTNKARKGLNKLQLGCNIFIQMSKQAVVDLWFPEPFSSSLASTNCSFLPTFYSTGPTFYSFGSLKSSTGPQIYSTGPTNDIFFQQTLRPAGRTINWLQRMVRAGRWTVFRSFF